MVFCGVCGCVFVSLFVVLLLLLLLLSVCGYLDMKIKNNYRYKPIDVAALVIINEISSPT